MTSSLRPLLKPEDFRGQRFRILPSKVLAKQYALLGATTVTTPFNDVYENLEKRTVDGQENSISNIYTKKFYQVQNYMTISNHNYLGYAVIFNAAFWNGLSPENRQSIKEASEETTQWLAHLAMTLDNEQLKKIRADSSIRIDTLTVEQKKAWIEALRDKYK
jgi:TRAP-type C4-dicarboxylate transport system substrate-binding protein